MKTTVSELLVRASLLRRYRNRFDTDNYNKAQNL